MDIPAELWIRAFLRTVAAGGGFATIARHGDDERGAVFVKVRALDGTASLFAPAPSALAGDGRAGRLWMEALPAGTAEAEVDQRLTREISFDSDIWIVEVEDRQRRHYLDGWLVARRG